MRCDARIEGLITTRVLIVEDGSFLEASSALLEREA
jgi:hypothetical protein